ncbi:GNAT family N-acetyltransferase [Reichenbachiella carrageenanivorans]|uniref:GNAT family N-acetyltransferase n=1 Tax=Reichenbachiella carrageenanivorans TaxID=2979869 RepID=A0ABY6D6K8_9BACT|nr:GNAT family N-acetyltransferase [Reichenbachiella carrageenanivorans]UXX80713.1 GNAT family N-acetyltransferase [Reichenbachiella carrageenanivorans]
MADGLQYRTLTPKDLVQMHRSFVEAFSSYQVSMKISKEAFDDRMLNKLNIRFDLSPGIFSGDKLVAFIFQSVNAYEGELTAYNGGTGVIPGYTGQGLAATMYEYIFPKLKKEGIEKCVLEVLRDNASAIRSYQKAGFEQVKLFQCLMLKDGVLKTTANQKIRVQEVSDFMVAEYAALATIKASWLDELSQIKYHLSKETILEHRVEGRLLGYLIFQPVNGRIAHLAVRSDQRGKGIATALVTRAHILSESKTLSILNIEMKEEGVINFFMKLGFQRDLQQFEMQKTLIDV